MNNDEIIKRRLRWKCRRGMLELDICLQNYFDNYYDTFDAEQKKIFARLLEMEDTQLFAWFMKVEEPDDKDIKEMILKINNMKNHKND